MTSLLDLIVMTVDESALLGSVILKADSTCLLDLMALTVDKGTLLGLVV